MGNIIGSNMFNTLFVLPTTAVIVPVAVPEGSALDLACMLGLAVVLVPIVLSHKRSITRWEGGLLAGSYFAFLAWQALRAIG